MHVSLSWEMSVVIAVVILIASADRQLSTLPPTTKCAHWAIVAIYSVVGAGGFRFLVRFCVNQEQFLHDFSQPNVLGLKAWPMSAVALAFSLAATLLLFATLRLGRLRRWARTAFGYLVIPVSVLYPVVMATALGLVGRSTLAAPIALGTALVLLALACFSIMFYRSQSITRTMTSC